MLSSLCFVLLAFYSFWCILRVFFDCGGFPVVRVSALSDLEKNETSAFLLRFQRDLWKGKRCLLNEFFLETWIRRCTGLLTDFIC